MGHAAKRKKKIPFEKKGDGLRQNSLGLHSSCCHVCKIGKTVVKDEYFLLDERRSIKASSLSFHGSSKSKETSILVIQSTAWERTGYKVLL